MYPIKVQKIKQLLLATIGVLVALIGYYIWVFNANERNRVKPVRIEAVSDADVVIQDVEFVEYSNERQLWILRAKEATVYSAQKEKRGKGVAVDFFGTSGKSTDLTSDEGVIDDVTGNITLSGHVQATAIRENMVLYTEQLVYKADVSKIVSDVPVRLERANMIITGNAMEAEVDLTSVIVHEHVTTTLIKSETGEKQAVIVSDKLKFDNLTQQAIYSGNVIVTQEKTEMRADKMIVSIRRTETSGEGIEQIETFGNVRITQENKVVHGEKGVYISAKQKAVIEGSATQQARAEDHEQHLIHYADKIEFQLSTNTVHAEGNISTVFAPEEGV